MIKEKVVEEVVEELVVEKEVEVVKEVEWQEDFFMLFLVSRWFSGRSSLEMSGSVQDSPTWVESVQRVVYTFPCTEYRGFCAVFRVL